MTRHAENEASSVSHGRQHRESRFESGLPALQGAARWINVVNVAVGFYGGYCVRYVVASMASIGRSVKEGNMNGCGKCMGTLDNPGHSQIYCGKADDDDEYEPKIEGYRCPDCVAKLEAAVEWLKDWRSREYKCDTCDNKCSRCNLICVGCQFEKNKSLSITTQRLRKERDEMKVEIERLRKREKVWEKRWNILYDRGEGFGERDIPNEMLGIEEDLPLPDTETAPVEEGEGCGQPDPEQMVRWLRYAGS